MDINTVESFCECIADAEYADVAAKGFCIWRKTGNGLNITGDDLAELKNALMDLETGKSRQV
jgi:hypothetical protein